MISHQLPVKYPQLPALLIGWIRTLIWPIYTHLPGRGQTPLRAAPTTNNRFTHFLGFNPRGVHLYFSTRQIDKLRISVIFLFLKRTEGSLDLTYNVTNRPINTSILTVTGWCYKLGMWALQRGCPWQIFPISALTLGL